MKKSIISLILLISLSTQSAYPLFEGIKKKFAGSENIQKAKNLLNMKANIRCIRFGDNCSKEKRKMLMIISGLITALAVAGVAVVGKAIAGKISATSPKLSVAEEGAFELVKSKDIRDPQLGIFMLRQTAKVTGVNLKELKKDSMSLIGHYLTWRATQTTKYDLKDEEIVKSLIRDVGIKPTSEDIKIAKAIGLEKIGEMKLK